jgi:hypothetical protein
MALTWFCSLGRARALTRSDRHVKLASWQISGYGSRLMCKRLRSHLLVLLLTLFVWPAGIEALAQAPGFADLTHPQRGEAVSGLVTIEGSAAHPSFVGYEIAFAFDPNPMDTWFPVIDSVQTPVIDGRLGIWDTSGIQDGNYQLRLRVLLENGATLEALVSGLRVRNYTPIETSTPAPLTSQPSPTSPNPTRTARPTPLPVVSTGGPSSVLTAFRSGGVIGGLILLFLGGYFFMRRAIRLRWSNIRMRQTYSRSNRRRSTQNRKQR